MNSEDPSPQQRELSKKWNSISTNRNYILLFLAAIIAIVTTAIIVSLLSIDIGNTPILEQKEITEQNSKQIEEKSDENDSIELIDFEGADILLTDIGYTLKIPNRFVKKEVIGGTAKAELEYIERGPNGYSGSDYIAPNSELYKSFDKYLHYQFIDRDKSEIINVTWLHTVDKTEYANDLEFLNRCAQYNVEYSANGDYVDFCESGNELIETHYGYFYCDTQNEIVSSKGSYAIALDDYSGCLILSTKNSPTISTNRGRVNMMTAIISTLRHTEEGENSEALSDESYYELEELIIPLGKSFTNNQFGLTFNYPEDWQIDGIEDSSEAVTIQKKGEYIYFTVEPNNYLEPRAQNCTSLGELVDDLPQRTIGNHITTNGTYENGTTFWAKPTKRYNYCLSTINKNFRFTFETLDNVAKEDSMRLFDEILDSVEFLE